MIEGICQHQDAHFAGQVIASLAALTGRLSLVQAHTGLAAALLRHSLAHVSIGSPAAQPRSRVRERWQAEGEPPAAARTRRA